MIFRSFVTVRSTTRHAISWLTVLAAMGALFACSGQADVGGSCSTRGAVDECVEGAVCDEAESGDPICLEICDSQDDCSEGYDCNGVSGSSIKACHPKE